MSSMFYRGARRRSNLGLALRGEWMLWASVVSGPDEKPARGTAAQLPPEEIERMHEELGQWLRELQLRNQVAAWHGNIYARRWLDSRDSRMLEYETRRT